MNTSNNVFALGCVLIVVALIGFAVSHDIVVPFISLVVGGLLISYKIAHRFD